MSFKKIITAIVLSLVIFLAPTTFKSVKAEDISIDEHVEVLSSGYSLVVDFYNQGGRIDDTNFNTLYEVAGRAVVSAEAIKPLVTIEEYDRKYRDKHNDVFRVFKNVAIYKAETLYDYYKGVFSPTASGIEAVNLKLREVKNLIQSATSYQVVVDAEQSFNDYVNSDGISKNTDKISTGSDQPITVKLTSSEMVFAESDIIKTEFFIDSAIIKNTEVALIGHEKLLDSTNGVVSFISVRWVRDDVVLDIDDVTSAPIVFAIEVADLNAELNEESCIQVVRYVGNREVEFIDGVSYDEGYIYFTYSDTFDTIYELDFAIVAKGYALDYSSSLVRIVNKIGILTPFETIAESLMQTALFSGYEKYEVVNFVLGAIALIILPIVLALLYFIIRLIVRAVKGSRRRKYLEFKKNKNKFKKEHGEYLQYKQNLEKEKKLAKKQVKMQKRISRLEKKKKT